MTSQNNADTVAAVIALHEAGAHILLCNQNKAPMYKGWKDSPVTIEEIERHSGLFGMIPASVNLIVVDIDTDYGPIESTREAVEESLGPPMFTVTTRSGGFHLYYHCHDSIGNSKFDGGDIRSGAGFVVLWEATAVAVALENIDDYEPISTDKWPFPHHQDAEYSYSNTSSSEYSEDQVRAMLSCLSPDMPYEDWYRIGMAVKAGGYHISLWEDWSAVGTEFKPGECAVKWKSFNGGTISMGTLVYMARQNGWEDESPEAEKQHGGKRQGAGRKVKDAGADADMILEKCHEQLINVFGRGVYAVNRRGLWAPLSRKNEDSLAFADRLLKECGDERTHGGRHLSEVLISLRAATANCDTVKSVSQDKLDRRIPILPTETGGYNLETGEHVANMRKYLQTERGYKFEPPPDELPDNAESELVLRFWNERTREVGQRLACYLLDARPVIDVAIGESGVGKGTIIELTMNAFNGMASSVSMQEAMGSQGRRWSVVETMLAEFLIVFIDEADKEPDRPVQAGTVNKWVDGTVSKSKKGVDTAPARRQGTAMLVGGDYPKLPFESQGLKRRFRAVYEIANKDEFTSHDWHILNTSEKAANAWKWLIVRECMKLAEEFDALEETETMETKLAAGKMFSESMPDQVKEIMATFSGIHDNTKFVTVDRIKEVIEGAGLKFTPNKVGMWLRIAFPDFNTQSDRTTVNGERHSVWRGVTELDGIFQ